jgi:hypothetical protein
MLSRNSSSVHPGQSNAFDGPLFRLPSDRIGSACAGQARDLTAGKLTSSLSHWIADVHGRQWSTRCGHSLRIRQWPKCSVCCRWPLASVLTPHGAKESLGLTTALVATKGLRGTAVVGLPDAIHAAPMTASIPLELAVTTLMRPSHTAP